MKAVLMTREGEPDVLEYRDVPEPEIRSLTQIKVRLRAAGVNPVDTKLRARGVFYADALPAILGCDGAGTVVEVGGGVTRFRSGDAVWFCNGGLGRESGCYAEYAVIDETVARTKPSALDFTAAAAGPLVLITAWEALYDRAGLEYGQHVLIHAGAGGVGHVAVQLAKLRGAVTSCHRRVEISLSFPHDNVPSPGGLSGASSPRRNLAGHESRRGWNVQLLHRLVEA